MKTQRKHILFWQIPFVLLLLCSLQGCAPSVHVMPHPVEFKVEHSDKVDIGHDRTAKGMTQWFYHCRPTFQTDNAVAQTGQQATITVRGVTMEIGLTIEQILPKDPGQNIVAHEEGHVAIVRRVYANAEQLAAQCCREIIGKQFSGDGATASEALNDASNRAKDALCKSYAGLVTNRATALSNDYDAITVGGLSKADPRQAVEKVFQDEATRIGPTKRID